jgi:hypothetical protein
MQAKAMLEKALEAHVKVMAEGLGLKYYHTHRSEHSVAGFPDDVIVSRTGKGSIYRELKRQGKDPSVEQQEWLDALASNGYDVGVWRPEDLFSGRILEELRSIA